MYTGHISYPGELSKVRYIGNTEAFDFISSDQFRNEIFDLVRAANPEATDADAMKMTLEYINGVEKFENFRPTGIQSNGKSGPWADVSYRFAAETPGDVQVFIGNIDDATTRIWWNTEMPAVLERSGATSINGVTMDKFKYLYNQLGGSNSPSALDHICSLVDFIPAENINPGFLDDVILYFDDTGKVIAIDTSPITGKDLMIWPDNARYEGTLKDTSKILEIAGGNADDVARVISASNDGVKGALEVLGITGNNIDDAVNMLGKVSGNADDAIKVVTAANNSVDDALRILEKTGNNVNKAVDILGKVGGNADDAVRVISAANNSVDDALRILGKTGNNVNKAVDILGKVSGNADDAIKVVTAANNSVDDALRILEKTGNNVNKTVDILGKVGGNADDAARIISAANNNVDDALRILANSGNNVDDAINILGKVGGNVEDAIKVINEANGIIDDAIKILDAADDIAKADANTNIFKSIFKTISNHPEATARITSYGAIGISAIGMINDAIKDFENGNDADGYRKIARWTVTMEASTAAAWGGAAIGTAIGGPVGFVVGFVLGVGFGFAADYLSGLLFDEIWDLFADAADAQPPRDPLAIDLGALGINLTTLENGVNFDLDKNGFAEKTAWIGIEDGFLVLDRNRDGIINDGGELFGDQVEMSNGLISASGFEALADLDENADGVIDHNDSIWNDLRIWVDANHNGVSDSGELKTFNELGIVSISLDVTREENVDTTTGTMEAEFSMVIFADGTQRKISEFWFPVNTNDTTQTDENGEIIKTIGTVPDISQAIAEDDSGRLAELYKAFCSSDDFVNKRYLLKQILYFITDATDINPNARGGNIDARDLKIIEAFMGREFMGVGGKNPNANAANILKKNVYCY